MKSGKSLTIISFIHLSIYLSFYLETLLLIMYLLLCHTYLILPSPKDERLPKPWLHLQVENIEETLEKIKANGGEVIKEKFEIGPDIGHNAFFKDVEGNQMALYSPSGAHKEKEMEKAKE